MPGREEGEIMEKEIKTIYPYKECEQYVNLLQENITRMANNSANCKNWLSAIIAGVFTVVFTKDANYIPELLTIIKIITLLFYFLDCLYLGLERNFIAAEKEFIKLCRANNPNTDDIKKMLMSFSKTINIEELTPNVCSEKARHLWKQLKQTFRAMFSWSTTPFYGTLLLVLHLI